MEKYGKLLGADYLFTTKNKEIPKKLKNQIQETLQIDFEREELKAICWIDTLINFISQYQFVLITSKRVITHNVTLKLNLISDITGIEQTLLKNIVIRSAGNRTLLFFASKIPNEKLINRLFRILNNLWLESKEQPKATDYKNIVRKELKREIKQNIFPNSPNKDIAWASSKKNYKKFKQENKQLEKSNQIIKIISKWIIGIFLWFLGIKFFFTGSFFGGLLIGFVGLSIMPPISERNKAKSPLWRDKYWRRSLTGFILILGFIISDNQIESDNTNTKVEEANKSNQNNKPQRVLKQKNKLNESNNTKVEKANKSNQNNKPQRVLEQKNKLNLSSIKWSNRFKHSQVRGEWYQVLYYFPENKNEITYLDDGNSEQKKLTLTASAYQTSYPYGLGDNPIFNYHFQGKNLIVTTRTALASEIYTFKVEFGNGKKLLRLTQEYGAIQVFKKKGVDI